jgi:hypothetical protein
VGIVGKLCRVYVQVLFSYKVYQQYPQEISDRPREQHLYVNPTQFTNNTYRKSVTDEEKNQSTTGKL